MPDYEIIGTERGFSADVTRQGKFDRFITYRGADQVLHFTHIPDEAFSVETAKAAVIKAEAERRLAQPIKFSTPSRGHGPCPSSGSSPPPTRGPPTPGAKPPPRRRARPRPRAPTVRPCR